MPIAMGKHTAEMLEKMEGLSGFELAGIAGVATPTSSAGEGAIWLCYLLDSFVTDFQNSNIGCSDDLYEIARASCNENNGTHSVWEIFTDLALYTEATEIEMPAETSMTDRALSIMVQVAERLLITLWNDLNEAMDLDDSDGE